MLREKDVLISDLAFPVDTGCKLNVHKTFRRRPGRLLHVLCTFNLCPVSTGLATLINKYFVNITAGLDLKRDSETHSDTPISQDGILERFDCHQSVLKVYAFKTVVKFSFHEVTEGEVRQEILRLDDTTLPQLEMFLLKC